LGAIFMDVSKARISSLDSLMPRRRIPMTVSIETRILPHFRIVHDSSRSEYQCCAACKKARSDAEHEFEDESRVKVASVTKAINFDQLVCGVD
jgi:hypothetical protein